MSDCIYDILASRYDAINASVDHGTMAECFLRGAERFSYRPHTVLDLCCGTGSMLLALAERGLDLQGVDISPNMLNEARDRLCAAGHTDVLLLCQDMREFELYGTVDAITCCLDSLNHLSSAKELEQVFRLAANYLEYGGILYFDLNSKYKYENIYGNNAYILEEEGMYCGWENYYDPKRGIAEFRLSVFEECEDGSYVRSDAIQREKYFSERTVKRALKAAGLEFCGVFGDTELSAPKNGDERLYYFAKRPEEGKIIK
ncbi:MAG: class I SAM-dependent methyltransferase [Clostridia bacterium]|nr:class I SAM-dependent methyltransferase [Clostridia bacterium]